MNREEILARARLRVVARNDPRVTEAELKHGLPTFLNQLGEALRRTSSQEPPDNADIEQTATRHGDDLFHQGVTIGHVVHDYGDLCQVITGLAIERTAPIEADEFRTLNLCLDDAIAEAVTQWAHLRERALTSEGTERLGALAHEMRNLLSSALLSFESIRTGVVAPGGSTGAMVQRSLMGLLSLVDRSMADVRLEAGLQQLERVVVSEIIGEVEIGASIIARQSGLSLLVATVDPTIVVLADRQILASAVLDLLHNALKLTAPRTTVRLRASATATRVLIEVEDECGGLAPGRSESLLRPFSEQSGDRSGIGLGLSICVKAVKSIDGELRIQDLPGKGCIFIIDLPKQPPPPTSIHDHHRKTDDGKAGSGGSQVA